jgi:S1-C subfamily serine protease
MSARNLVSTLLTLAAVAGTAAVDARAARLDMEQLMTDLQGSVVPVRITLRPIEPPPGGEGQKVEEVFCGLVVSDDGLVVVSGDVFADPGGDPRTTLEPVSFDVLATEETEYSLTAEGLNRDLNLAYLRFSDGLPEGYSPVQIRDNAAPRIGDEILVVGLMPERYDYARTFWTGRISARLESPRTMYAVTTFIQDLSIGGLAVDAKGIPLGLVAEDVLPAGQPPAGNTSNPLTLFGSLSQGPRVGYPMIFPFDLLAEDIASPPPLEREPQKAWFGITMQPLNRDLGEYWNIDNPGGIIVSAVLEGSPAQGAGLHPRDILLRLGDVPVTAREYPDLTTFRQRVEKLTIGEQVDLLVWREGQEVTLQLHPGVAPRTGFQAREFEDEIFGLTVRELTVDVLQARNLPSTTGGVLISEMETAGWSQVAGLGTQDIILRVNGTPIPDLDAFQKLMEQLREEQPREVYFFVQRNVETRFVKLRTDW